MSYYEIFGLDAPLEVSNHCFQNDETGVLYTVLLIEITNILLAYIVECYTVQFNVCPDFKTAIAELRLTRSKCIMQQMLQKNARHGNTLEIYFL